MNRNYYIDELLKQYIDYYKNDANPMFGDSIFYSGLRNYGMTNEEYENKNMREYFDIWIEHFEKNKNLHVYVDYRQKSFLQFWNEPESYDYPNAEYAKLYVSFNKEAMPKCVTKIFDFISKHNMISCSKVSDSLRSDSVVLRLGSIKDVEKVIKFINSDKYLVANAKPTNPFLPKEGIVGMAYDGMLSFNSTIALLLNAYFQEAINQNCIDYITADNFKKFIKYYKEKILSSPSILESFLIGTGDRKRFDSKGEMANNYMQVIDYIEKSLDGNFSFDDYKKSFEKFSREMKDNSINSSYSRFIQSNNKISYNSFVQNENSQTYGSVELEKELLDAYIKYASTKYGKDNVILYLNSYMCGNSRAITRDNGFRKKFKKYLPKEKIDYITNSKLKEYISNILYENTKETIPIEENITEHYNQFYNACMQTYLKYDYYQLEVALKQALKGNYGYFTNSNGNSRDYLNANFTKEILNKCIAYLGYINQSNLIQGCVTTIQNDALNYQQTIGSQNKAM